MQPDDEDDGGGREVEERAGKKQTTKVSFWTLLKNPMMAVLCFSRIADPMATTSIFVCPLSLYSILDFTTNYSRLMYICSRICSSNCAICHQMHQMLP